MRVALIIVLSLVMSGCAIWRKDAAEPVENTGPVKETAEPVRKPGETPKPSDVLKPESLEIPSPSTDKFYMRLMYFPAAVTTEIRLDASSLVPGTLLSGEDDLGLDDQVDQSRLDVNLRMSRRHNLHLDYFKLNRFSQVLLADDIDFGDFRFEEGTTFRTKLDWRVFTLTHTYSFIQGERFEAGLGIGIHIIEAQAEGMEPGTNDREEASEVGIFPTLNGIISYRISKHFAVTGRALWFSAAPDEFDGTMAEYHADIQYRWHKNAAVGLGYTRLVTKLQVFDADDPLLFNLDTSGPELFVRFSF
jgi:hypothetical protein